MTAYDLGVRDRLASLQAQFVARGFPSEEAMNQAYAVLKRAVHESACTMAYNDAFLVVGLACCWARSWCGCARCVKKRSLPAPASSFGTGVSPAQVHRDRLYL